MIFITSEVFILSTLRRLSMIAIGVVEGKTCILIDDMIDTAGTICHAADALAEA